MAPSTPASRRSDPPNKRTNRRVPARAAALKTLSIDVGGTGLKASVLDAAGAMVHDRVKIPTPYPLTPQKLIASIAELTRGLPSYDRVSLGFPGMVRAGHVLSAPHFISPDGPDLSPSDELVKAWDRFDLQGSLETALAKPARVANDADVQGAAVVSGQGLEMVLTLGTGFGSAIFYDGKLMPHMELAHHPFRKGASYNQAVGEAARQKLGTKKWSQRVVEAVDVVRRLTFFDHCYVGGGNSAKVKATFPADVTLVSNDAGILGGIKLWERTR